MSFTQGIKHFEKSVPQDDLLDIRTAAIAKFMSQDWPKSNDEEWRRTRIADLGLDDLKVQTDKSDKKTEGQTINAILPTWLANQSDDLAETISAVESSELAVYIDTLDTLACPVIKHKDRSGIKVYDLTTSTEIFSKEKIEKSLGTRAMILLATAIENSDNRFVSLNLAFAQPAILVHISKNTLCEEPIVIDWNFKDGQHCNNPLLVVIAEEGSQVTFVQKVSGAAEGMVNHQTLVDIKDNAHLTSNIVQSIDHSGVYIAHDAHAMGRDSRLWQTGAWLGSGLSKVRSTANLNQPGTEAHLDGIYFARKEQHFDIRTVQNHNSHNANSRAYYKGVVRDSARTIYQGLIYVSPHAPKTDAYLTNKNMVLNDGARADSIPSLNILTDDVKCSHGSTTGKLPPEQLYYLQTRGFSALDAKKALVGSYLGEVLDRFPSMVSPYVRDIATNAIED